jgi:hypothetical protein
MGSVLELGKVITTVWLHKYWDRAALQFKLYLVPAIGILMLITSMGIFGFLSKAHLDQAVPAGDVSAQVQIFDDKIRTEKDNIEAARKALKQMDAQVDEKLSRTTDDRGAERAVQIRRAQSKERTNLQNEISAAQKKISSLQEQRAPIASQARKVEAEVGPIKYIAALIYGDNPDANLLEKAVRWVIILIVLVFDPLALVLILAADQTFAWAREDKRKGWKQQWIPTTEDPWHDIEPLTDEQLDKVKEQSGVPQNLDGMDAAEFLKSLNIPVLEGEETQAQRLIDEEQAKNKTLERELEAVKATAENLKKKVRELGQRPPKEKIVIQEVIKEVPVEVVKEVIVERPVEVIREVYIDRPVEPPQPVIELPAADIPYADPPPLRGRPAPATDEEPINPTPKAVVIHDNPNQIVIPDFSIGAESTTPVNAGFGTNFPPNPIKGDMYLRVDYLPSRLYKWNEKKWIEVDKTKTDSFAYDQAYIQHLIEKIDSGEYDVDLLTDVEREQISRYLNGKSKQ